MARFDRVEELVDELHVVDDRVGYQRTRVPERHARRVFSALRCDDDEGFGVGEWLKTAEAHLGINVAREPVEVQDDGRGGIGVVSGGCVKAIVASEAIGGVERERLGPVSDDGATAGADSGDRRGRSGWRRSSCRSGDALGRGCRRSGRRGRRWGSVVAAVVAACPSDQGDREEGAHQTGSSSHDRPCRWASWVRSIGIA